MLVCAAKEGVLTGSKVKGQTLVKRDNSKDVTTEMFNSMRAVQPYFWTVDWRFPTQTLGGHWEMKTPLREATLSTEVMAVALLLLCCQRVMFASLKGDYTLSKPTARLHVQLVMLISTVCSVQDRSQTSIKHCQATSSQTGEIVFFAGSALHRRLLAACYHSQ